MRAQGLNVSLLLIFCFLFNLNQYVVHCETYKQFLARTLPEVCPYSTFCTTGPAKLFKYKKYSPCCKPCSCKNYCIITGSCCPDFPAVINKNPPIQPTAECSVPVHYSYKQFTNVLQLKNSFGFSTYHIVKTCPEEYPDAEVARKCMHPDTNSDFVQKDVSVVSDGQYYVFFNRYCAICNGANTFTHWNLKMVCVGLDYNVDNVNDRQQLFNSLCFIISSPPTANIGGQSRCVIPPYTECNMTGRWIHPDPNIERACKSTVFLYVAGGVEIYKNPYCYKCNNDGNGKLSNICRADGKEDTEKGIGDRPFSSVLDLSVAAPISRRNGKCQSSDVFDFHFERCRPLHCPLTLTPNNGRCVKVLQEVDGLSIHMAVEVSFAHGNPVDFKPESVSDFEHLKQAILDDIGISKHPCLRCTTRFRQRKDNTGLAIVFGFRTNATCTVTTVVDTANKWRLGLRKSLEFSVIKNATRLKFFKGLIYDYLMGTEETSGYEFTSPLYFDDEESVMCPASVYLKPMFYCAFVDISQNEHTELLSRNHSNIRMADFVNVTVENGIAYRICLDHYLPTQHASIAFSLYQRVEWAAIASVALFGIIVSK